MSEHQGILQAGEQAGEEAEASDERIERLVAFDGPPEAFLRRLVATQCGLAGAEAGVLLRGGGQGLEVLAAHPELGRDGRTPVWLAQVEQLLSGRGEIGRGLVRPVPRDDGLYGVGPERYVVVLPLRRGGGRKGATDDETDGGREVGLRGAAAFLVRGSDEAAVDQQRRELELSMSLLAMYEMRLRLRQRQHKLESLSGAMQVLAAVNRQEHFKPAALAFCNEIASRWSAERVSLGVLGGRYVRLQAMSHVDKIDRKMNLTQAVESAMEECLDQATVIVHPEPNDAAFISQSTRALAKDYGSMAIASLPLYDRDEPTAALTVERDGGAAFTSDDLELLGLTCELVGPRLLERQRQDRWFGARWAGGVGSVSGKLVGAQHTWAKLAALGVIAGLVSLFFVEGTYKTSAPFVIKAKERHVVPAPYAGYIASVGVEPGDVVSPRGGWASASLSSVGVGSESDTRSDSGSEAGQTEPDRALARLETAELELNLAQAKAQRLGALKEADKARDEGSTVDAQIALAKAREQAAKMDLLEHRIESATIMTPVRGVVLSGRLKEKVGGPVDKGEVLFRIAPLDSLVAEMRVPDAEIHLIHEGQEGRLAAASYPGRHVPFVVERINPIAEVIDGQNVFRVQVRLDKRPAWLRPGMEGVAKARVGQRSYAYIWFHDAVEWVRMKLWI